MRRVGIAWALVLCGVLSVALVHPASVDGSRPTQSNLPAEVDERSSDPEVGERSHGKAYKGALFSSSTVIDTTSHIAPQCSRPGLAHTARHDDPLGSLANSLRGPPA